MIGWWSCRKFPQNPVSWFPTDQICSALTERFVKQWRKSASSPLAMNSSRGRFQMNLWFRRLCVVPVESVTRSMISSETIVAHQMVDYYHIRTFSTNWTPRFPLPWTFERISLRNSFKTLALYDVVIWSPRHFHVLSVILGLVAQQRSTDQLTRVLQSENKRSHSTALWLGQLSCRQAWHQLTEYHPEFRF